MPDKPESIKNYNPDVLSCLANLSNDEVFTPPKLANDVLDLLPESIWHDKNATFLDPCVKTGIFLREIVKRLNEGLKDEIPDLDERINHICTKQVFGIAITCLTSLLSRRSVYCSRTANGKYSVCSEFTDKRGNIKFDSTKHAWKDGKCIFCGASQDVYDREEGLETYAYQFIHTEKPEDIFKMKFDVIVGNPPYQLSDGGNGKSAIPIYQLFVEQAKKLNPRYLTMVIPSRWFTGGRGLEEFRKNMLSDDRIRKIVDYENFKDIFPGVDLAGGACYFLWNRDNRGKCEVVNVNKDTAVSAERYLNQYPVFIRSNKALSIVEKVRKRHLGKYMDSTVSASKPFGIRTYYEPKDKGIPCQFIQKIGLKYANPEDITDNFNLLNKWKFLAPRSPIAGQTDFTKPVSFYYDGNTRIIPPGTCCTESFIVLHSADTEEEIKSFKTYLFTKTVRFLLLQCVVSQDVTREKFRFVPSLEKYSGVYTDKQLCEIWGITDEEWQFIDSKISSGEDKNND